MIFANINIATFFASFMFLLETDDSDSGALLPLLLCLSGFIFFVVMYQRYRNSDKRHSHEKETSASIQNLQQYDQFNKHRKRLRNSMMSDRNDNRLEGSLNTSTNLVDKLTKLKDSVNISVN
jgi:hypothetical protein